MKFVKQTIKDQLIS